MKVNLHVFRQYVNQLSIKEPGDVYSEFDLVNTIMFLKKNNVMIQENSEYDFFDDEGPKEYLIGEEDQKLDEYHN